MYLRVVGGEVGATSSLAPKIGPLGLVSIFRQIGGGDTKMELTNKYREVVSNSIVTVL